ncbi:BT4734/BF3469 family protein [Flagellimonas sp.]|uniref:BT4734/BF3469 family protein n=1 Tax=Flagellimonas sp. TaxID=2058762 RepID=UPI003BA89978
MFNYYKSIKSSSRVLGLISVEKYLDKIKKGDENLEKIIKARDIYDKDMKAYDKIKTSELPCYTLNFTFQGKRSNETIKNSTGYLYLDVDGNTEMDLSNPLIFSSWHSLSGTGRGALVKVENLNTDNFKCVYKEVAEEIGIEADMGACKFTQPNVLSYDPEIYTNTNSISYTAPIGEYEKSTQYSNNIIEEGTIGTVMGSSFEGLRFDNLDELMKNVEFNGDVIYDYGEKVGYSSVYIPYGGIKDGTRNQSLCGYAYQLRNLNPGISERQLFLILKMANEKYCRPPESTDKIKGIVQFVYKSKLVDPKQNKTRRFLFNPDYYWTRKEKRQLVIRKVNQLRSEKSRKKLENAIEDWDFASMGKITQKGISKKSTLNIKTVQKYWSEFHSKVQLLNQEYKK